MTAVAAALRALGELAHEFRARRLAGDPGRERVPLTESVGRMLAEEVRAATDLPAYDHAAMDGFAVASGELAKCGPETPQRLRIGEPIFADTRFEAGYRLAPGTCQPIATGAPVPAGADAVLRKEHVEREDEEICVRRSGIVAGRDLRQAGEHCRCGTILLNPGHLITAHDLAALCVGDRTTVAVEPRVTAAVVLTGDELRAAGVPGPGRIIDCNGPWLAAQLGAAQVGVRCLSYAEDALDRLRSTFAEAADASELLLAVGGSSVGERDFVREALGDLGFVELFAGVEFRPGRPFAALVDRERGCIALCIPGNPGACRATTTRFVLPLIRGLQGRPGPQPFHVPLQEALATKPKFEGFWRARLVHVDGRWRLHVPGRQNSGQPMVESQTHGWVVVPPAAGAYPAGRALAFFPDEGVETSNIRRQLSPQHIAFVGASGVGKTHLIARLVPVLKQLRPGLRIGVLKSSHHSPELDRSGSDTALFKAAGAEAIAFVGPGERLFRIPDSVSPSRSETVGELGRLAAVDLVIVEGMKRAQGLKVEVCRAGFAGLAELVGELETAEVLARVGGEKPNVGPHFQVETAAELQAFAAWLLAKALDGLDPSA